MPPGFSGLDFYYILPELILTGGALVLLVAEALTPRRQGMPMWLALATVVATAVSLLSFWGRRRHGVTRVARHLMGLRSSSSSSSSWRPPSRS